MEKTSIMSSRLYKFLRKNDEIPELPFTCLSFADDSHDLFDPWYKNNIHFECCILMEITFVVDDDTNVDEEEREPKAIFKRYYFIQPQKITTLHRHESVFRIRELNETRKFYAIFDYLAEYSIEEKTSDPRNPAWTDALEAMMMQFLEINNDKLEFLRDFKYHQGKYHEPIYARLKNQLGDEKRTKAIMDDFHGQLAPSPHRNRPEVTDYEDDYADYSDSELEDMYRAAYENDPSALWNND